MTSKPNSGKTTALVLQGGGALGAYQAGVYERLAANDYQPDWVAGISIGAINAAIIAGNTPDKRVDKLRAFWEGTTAGLQGHPIWFGEAWRTLLVSLYRPSRSLVACRASSRRACRRPI